MKAVILSIVIGCGVGIVCGDLTARSVAVRERLGTISRRGHLLALVHGRGIYESDVDRALRESDYLNDIERSGAADIERPPALNKLIANTAARALASHERAPYASVAREFSLLQSQVRDNQTWAGALRGRGLSSLLLWMMVKDDLRARQWVPKQIENQIRITDEECRRFYQEHSEKFFVPERLRVSHVFLAAPVGTPPEMIETKRSAIETLSVRLASGEDFAVLAAQNSEDEATKFDGGDLGYFTAARMPADFVAAAVKLREGEISQPIQTRLGFHILKLAEIASSRQRSFDEARNDIAIELANQKRVPAIRQLIADLSAQTDYLRPL